MAKDSIETIRTLREENLLLLKRELLWARSTRRRLVSVAALCAVLGGAVGLVVGLAWEQRSIVISDASHGAPAWLGLEIASHPHGALITDVLADSPAERAGLRAGGIVVAVGGKPIDGPGALLDAIRRRGAGQIVELMILEVDGRILILRVQLAHRCQQS